MDSENPIEKEMSDVQPQNEPTPLPHGYPVAFYSVGPNPTTERLQSFWKTILFLLFAAAVAPVLLYALGAKVFGPQGTTPDPGFLLYLEAGNFAVVAGLTLALARIERRPFGEYGLPLSDAFGANFWLGLLLGLAEGSVLIGAILLLGGYSFGMPELQGTAILKWGGIHLLLFGSVGLCEEFLFRGYPLVTLSRAMGFWPAAILLSAGFGLVHLSNRGENAVGAASVAAVGLLFAFTLKRSGNLWYAVGLHAGFDWAESFLYSVPDSGEMLKGHLSNAVLHGPDWLTGGSVGPEGSVFCFVTIALQFLVANWLFPAKKEVMGETEGELKAPAL
jgi:membrane protease YdiL (CAAX protease family)